MSKLRTATVSGNTPTEVLSRARAHKPPAKAISARNAAGLKVGGGKIPPKIRKRLDKEPLPARVHPTDARAKQKIGSTRYGRREPKAGGHDHAAEIRDARPSRRANTPAADPGTRRDKEARIAPRH
jgi:hypothetical protein